MDWKAHEALAREWREKTGAYVEAINAFVATGLTEGWEEAGEQPNDPRDSELGTKVAAVARAANEAGEWKGLREHFPPAQAPFISILEKHSIGIHGVVFLDEDRVAATVGSPWRPDAVMAFGFDGGTEHAPEGALALGASPDRRHLAFLHEDHVRVTEGWGGRELGRYPRPQGDEGTVDGVEELEEGDDPAPVEQLVVMPGGGAVLLATSRGIFQSTDTGVRRIAPDTEQLTERVEHWDYEGEPYPLRTDMTHVAVSPDGSLIACGYQDSQHELRKADGTLVGAFGPLHSEYPHHAAFAPDGAKAIFNSCHFYGGVTSIGELEQLVGLELDAYEEDIRLLPLETGARVYDSAFHDGHWLLGDANGYIRAMTPGGDLGWQHFVGSSVGGIDVSPSGERLAIATAAGYLALMEKDASDDPYRIGFRSPFRERIRYVRWAEYPLMRW
ncbi:MAG: hypothetical protein JJ863_08665 [Deltaproteobacteria bacterium]|nr:hypothetical protein [Deltaproteobacteria bacterium]